MRRRDIVIGIVAIAVILLIVNRLRSQDPQITTTPTNNNNQQQLEDITKKALPSEGDKVSLNDVLGVGASAIATRQVINGSTKITLLADLPDLEQGNSYQAWAESGEEDDPDYELITLGILAKQKGGWIGEFDISRDLSSFKYLIISEETNIDATIETVVVAGSFSQ